MFHDQNIVIDVKQTENGNLAIKWRRNLYGKKLDSANEKNVAFLIEQAARLKQVLSELQSLSTDDETMVPENELHVINKFCRDFLTAIELAIQDATVCTSEDDCVAVTYT